jgi:hypothetical protein
MKQPWVFIDSRLVSGLAATLASSRVTSHPIQTCPTGYIVIAQLLTKYCKVLQLMTSTTSQSGPWHLALLRSLGMYIGGNVVQF